MEQTAAFWWFPEGSQPPQRLESVSIPEPRTKLGLSRLQIREASNSPRLRRSEPAGFNEETGVIPSSVGRLWVLKTWRRRRRRNLGLISILLRELQPEASLRLQLHPDLWGISGKLETDKTPVKTAHERLLTTSALEIIRVFVGKHASKRKLCCDLTEKQKNITQTSMSPQAEALTQRTKTGRQARRKQGANACGASAAVVVLIYAQKRKTGFIGLQQ